MPRPRKPYHLLSKSGKRRRDIEEEVNAKREMRKIYMKEYRAKNNNARMVMVSEQQEQMSSSISSRHSSIKDVASITSNTCIDHMLSTPTRDDGTSLNRFGSVQTPIEVLQERLHESHYLKSIIEVSASKRIEESKLRDEESRKRQKYIDDAESNLKSASCARDEILKELYAEMKKESNQDPSAVVIHETLTNIVDSNNRSPPSAPDGTHDITMEEGDDENDPPMQMPFASISDPSSTQFNPTGEFRFHIGSAGPSPKNKRKTRNGRFKR